MLRLQNSRLLCILRGRNIRENSKWFRNSERFLHNDVKKPLFDGKKVLKTGLLTGAVLVGGIFIKLHSATVGRDEDNNKNVEESSENKHSGLTGRSVSLVEAIQQCRDLLQRKKDETGSPGVVIAVSVDGRDVWTEGFGYSDVENRLKCTPDTIFRIASISKSITMTGVAKLWENGDLDLDKPVQFYVPEFPEKTWNGEKVTITTRQLLSHLGGIRHYDKDYMKNQSNTKCSSDGKNPKSSTSLEEERKSVQEPDRTSATETKDEIKLDENYIKRNYSSVLESLKLFKDDPLVHKPESSFLYSTHGWILVSAVVEKASKMPFKKFLKEVLDELGMENTYLEEHKPLIYNRGRHYVKNKKGRLENAPYVDLSYKWAGGGIVSNVIDLTTFGNAMLYSYQSRDYSTPTHQDLSKQLERKAPSHVSGYLTPETMSMMWTPQAVIPECTEWEGITGAGYGLGWRVWSSKKEYEFCKDQKFFVSHTGGAIGASSVLLIFPREYTITGSERDGMIGNLRDNVDSRSQLNSSPPKGVVVAIIVNIMSVGLNKTAFDIARIFERVDFTK